MVKPDYNAKWLAVKHCARYIPAHVGLVNYGAFQLQINEIRPSDIFLVSYPKSGNTWLRYIVATALRGSSNFSFQELEAIVPDVYVSKTKINSATQPRIVKAHHPLFNYYPCTVYIYRNVFDVIVSYYHYAINAKQFTGTLSMFIQSKYHTRYFGPWAQHVQSALAAKAQGKKIHILSYEGLLQNTEQEIEDLLRFMNITPVVSIREIADKCDFTKLQQTEKEKGSYFGNDSLFFRKGKHIQNQTELTERDKMHILEWNNTGEMMKQLNYLKQ